MSLKKDYLQKLEDALKEHNQLKRDLRSRRLESIGLYEKAKEVQKPIIDAIKAVPKTPEHSTVDGQLETNQTHQSHPESLLKPVTKTQQYTSNKYVPQPSNRRTHGFPIWVLGQNDYVFIEVNDQEFIYNISKVNAKPILLTDGLNEIFFNNGNDKTQISTDDIKTWESLMKESGITSQYKNSTYYSQINPKPPSRRSERLEAQQSKPMGEGLNKTITISSDPKELCKELELQLQATLAGNTGTFNHVNGLLMELMKQKLITSKYYRKILRNYFYV